MGSGIAVGYGVVSHEIALSGYLARQLTSLTQRGVDIDIAAEAGMLIVEATHKYSRTNLARYDASLLVLGDVEALQLMPVKVFRDQVRTLVALLDSAQPHSFVLTVTAAASVGDRLPRAYTNAVVQRTLDFTRIIHEECESSGVTPITVAPLDRGAAAVSREHYLHWASSIAPHMVGALDEAACRRLSAGCPLMDEDGRLKALLDLDVLDETKNPRFDEIVEMARNLFGTDVAALNFIDADQMWIKSFAGTRRGNVARSDSACAVTIQRPELLVVEDLSADPRFRDRSWVGGIGGARFYAGYPIESPNGHRVGALCIIDSKPRTFSERDHALLRQLALRLQAMVGDSERPRSRLG